MGRLTRGTIALAAVAAIVTGCAAADPADDPVALPAAAEVERLADDAPPVSEVVSLEAAAGICVIIEDGDAGPGTADGVWGQRVCDRARVAYGDELTAAITAERERLAEFEAAIDEVEAAASASSLSPAEHAELRATWIADVCAPATGDEDACRGEAYSEAWPWTSNDPLSDLETRYSEPGYCEGYTLNEQAAERCAALVEHYTS